MSRLGPLVVRYRVVILVASALVVCLSLAALPRLRIDAGARSLLFVEPEEAEAFERYVSAWGGDRFLAVTLELPSGDVFTAQRLQALRRLTSRLAALEGVDRAESLTEVSLPVLMGEDLHVGSLVPDPVPIHEEALAALRQRALASPLLRHVLMDDRGRLVAINLWLRHSDDDVAVVVRITERVEALIKEPAGVDWTPRVIGGPVVVRAVMDITRQDSWILSLAPLVLVGLFLLLLTRSVRGSLLALQCFVASGMATFGLMAITGKGVNLLTSMMPGLIMVISVADVMHLMRQVRVLEAEGMPWREAVSGATSRVALPCLLTTLTTGVGFGSLALSDIPQVRLFGLFAAAGIAFAFVFAILTVPAQLSLMKAPSAAPSRPLRLEGALAAMGAFGFRRPVAVLCVALVLGVAGGVGVGRIEVESSALRFLPKDHPVLTDLSAVEHRLMGTMGLILHLWDRRPREGHVAAAEASHPPVKDVTAKDATAKDVTVKDVTVKDATAKDATAVMRGGNEDEVLVDPDDSATPRASRQRSAGRERIRHPEVLAALEGFAEHMRGVRGVRKVISIADTLKEVNRVMQGGDARHFQLPTDPRLIASYLEVLGGQDPRALEQLINFERSAANVMVMCIAHTSVAMTRITQAAREYLARPEVRAALGPDVAAEITGYAPLLGQVADRIVETQMQSCFVALGIICLVLVLVLGSLRGGLVAMVTNVFPILCTLGLMGWLGITLNITTVMIASIALGIAVDDTIHVLVRLRRERRRGAHSEAALEATFRGVGPALVHTTAVISGGFLVLLLAALMPARHLGMLTAFTMVTALGADLLLLPALVRLLRPWRLEPPHQ